MITAPCPLELGGVRVGATICHDHYLGLLPRYLAGCGARLAKTGIRWTAIGALAPPGCYRVHVRERQSMIAARLRKKWEMARHVAGGTMV